MVKNIEKDFKKFSSGKKAQHSARFFRTGKGEYGEGDLFLGLTNPQVKDIVRKYKKEISLGDTLYFLRSEIHEYRSFALEVLKYRYQKGSEQEKKKIVDIYVNNLKYVNNWDLVDLSAPHILGNYLLDKDRDILYDLVQEDSLWSKRVAILSTFTFIKHNEFDDTLKISRILLNHEHDLIHKAVGWMLREVWKRDSSTAERFIKKNYNNIPRTALRYAIEKMEESKRKQYLRKEFI